MTDYSKYGYRIDLENRKRLEDTAVAMPAMTFAAPEEIDPRGWCQIENQGSMGSCQGHALTSVGEMAYYIATGEIIQFSPMWAYLKTQELDGLLGRDCGSTIDGGRRCAEQFGLAELSVFPYPNPVHYSTQIPQGAVENASKFRIKNHVMLSSYDGVFQFLASGLGGVEIGISWNGSMTPNREGRIENYSPGGGGHALALLGYSGTVKDSQGRPYAWLANSWSEQWDAALKGWALVAPRAIEQMCQDRSVVMIGLSDMSVLKPRKFDYNKNSIFHPYKQAV